MIDPSSLLDLRHAESAAELAACFPVMRELRPHLADAADFAARVAHQRAEGYRLLAAWHDQRPLALAGYRVQQSLAHGRFVYVDDLVSAEAARRVGLGARLLDAVAVEGRKLGCTQLVLDTGLGNVLAHRFYHREGLLIRSLRFARPLE